MDTLAKEGKAKPVPLVFDPSISKSLLSFENQKGSRIYANIRRESL